MKIVYNRHLNMDNSYEKLESVLQGYANFLGGRKSAPPKHQLHSENESASSPGKSSSE